MYIFENIGFELSVNLYCAQKMLNFQFKSFSFNYEYLIDFVNILNSLVSCLLTVNLDSDPWIALQCSS